MEKVTLFGSLSAGLYLLGSFLYTLRFLGKITFRKEASLFVSFAAVIFHTIALYFFVETPFGQNLSIANVACLIIWAAAVFISIAMVRSPLENLMLLIHPLALMSVLAALACPQNHTIQTRFFPLEMAHILLSILGNGLLLIAAIQAVLIALQERILRQAPGKPLIQIFPPIQVMEKLLFEFIRVGLIVLTLALVTGFLAWRIHTPYQVIYKLAFSLLAWFIFAILLWGRKHFGWRGSKMVRWTTLGAATLAMAYFGSYYLF